MITLYKAVGARATNSNASKIGRYIKKLDVETGAEIWNTTLATNNATFGEKSAFETIAFTSDGGFVVGGYANGTATGFPNFKSGGQVEAGVPIMQKFAKSVAEAKKLNSRPQPSWSWGCNAANNCSTKEGLTNTPIFATFDGMSVNFRNSGIIHRTFFERWVSC